MATWRAACRVHPAPAYLLHVPTLAFPFTTDHFFSPVVTSVKQFSLLPFQVVQKPSFESFQVPSLPTPVVPCGLRVTLPSALNTIGYQLMKTAYLAFTSRLERGWRDPLPPDYPSENVGLTRPKAGRRKSLAELRPELVTEGRRLRQRERRSLSYHGILATV